MTPEASGIEVSTITAALRRRKWLGALVVCGCLAASLAMSLLQDKTYMASSGVLLSAQQEAIQPGTSLSDPNALQSQVSTQAQIVTSPGVEARVRKELGPDFADISEVSAAGVETTRVLAITVTASRSDVAARGANAYATAYIADRNASSQGQVSTFAKALAELNNSSKNELVRLDERIAAPGTSASEVQRLRVEREAVASQLTQSQQQYTEARLATLARGSGASLLAEASPPSQPTSPRPLQNAIYGLVIGVFLGCAAIFLAEQVDDRIGTQQDLSVAAPDVPLLASVPTSPGAGSGGLPQTLMQAEPFAPATEAYRTLRTNLSFLGAARTTQVIQVTSALPGEGKSTTAANLAVALAVTGQKVILVEADLRRPKIHRFFGIPNDQGMSTLLASGDAVGSSILQPVSTDNGSLNLLSSGPLPPNPNELLSGTQLKRIIAELRTVADYVVLDTSPVLPVADALLAAAQADIVVVVVHAGQTRRRDLTKALSSLRQTGTPLVGIVLNHAPLPKNAYAYGRQSKGYADEEVSASS